MSPASGGNLTPSSYHNNQNQQQRQIYAKLSYRDNPSQSTSSMASEHSNGDYHWSRGDQSYFDVTCPSFPLRMGHRMQHQQQHMASSSKVVRNSSALAAAAAASPKKDTSRGRLNGLQQQHPKSSRRRPPPPPTLQLSLYSKKSSGGSKINYNKQNKWLPYLGNNNNNGKENVHEKSNDLLLGKCSINVLRILSGKTPYFDEWCALHNDDNDNDPNNRNDKSRKRQPNNSDDVVGRVRIVIEYEPSDPPPRPGDMCVFANAYPLAEELYPVPLHSTRNAARTASATSSSSATYSQQHPSTTRRPKRYRVEEAVGDHIVLSYRTPVENWTCTFEAHRYLLLCVERHQACVEKYRERVLDLCDNVSQSPAMGTLARTVETLPDEGLVYVGAELVGGGVSLLGRWWEVGVEGLVEDVVDGINLDGRYTTLSEKEEEDVDGMNNDDSMEVPNQKSRQDKGNAIPGMPCCPITGLAMVEPVVAADGHTYERHAMARWLRTSNRSPLTGETLAHSELVPNYLLLSSLGNNDKVEAERVLDNENVNNV